MDMDWTKSFKSRARLKWVITVPAGTLRRREYCTCMATQPNGVLYMYGCHRGNSRKKTFIICQNFVATCCCRQHARLVPRRRVHPWCWSRLVGRWSDINISLHDIEILGEITHIFTFSAEMSSYKLYFNSLRNMLKTWFVCRTRPDASAVSIWTTNSQ